MNEESAYLMSVLKQSIGEQNLLTLNIFNFIHIIC